MMRIGIYGNIHLFQRTRDINNDATFHLIDDSFRQRITSVIIDDITKFTKDVEDCLKAAEDNK